MEILYYTCEVICQAWPVMLLMGIVSVPILWMWLEENNHYEPLDDYYFKKEKQKFNSKDNLIDPVDGHKKDLCDN